MKRQLASILALALVAGGSACAADVVTQASHLTVSHAWIRVLPGNLPGAGYATLKNDAGKPLAVIAASSPAYGDVMLHQSRMVNGQSRMVAVPRLTVPAHGSVQLAPGGYHLMMMHARHAVKPGQTVLVTLQMVDGSTKQVSFQARPANASGDGQR